MQSYAELLKSYIEKSGKTLDEISAECAKRGVTVHPTYISKLRLGKRPAPSDEITEALAEVTGGDRGKLLWLGWIDENPIGIKQQLMRAGYDVIQDALELYIKYPQAFKDENGLDDISLEDKPEYVSFMQSLGRALRNDEETKEAESILNNLVNTDTHFIKVPVLGRIPAGEPIRAESNIIEWATIPNPGNYKEGELFTLVVKGDSMIGSRIQEGDKVLVKVQPDVESGEIAVVNVNEEDATLKRVKKVNGQVILYPDNPKYEPIFIQNEHARIIGKVIQVIFEPKRL